MQRAAADFSSAAALCVDRLCEVWPTERQTKSSKYAGNRGWLSLLTPRRKAGCSFFHAGIEHASQEENRVRGMVVDRVVEGAVEMNLLGVGRSGIATDGHGRCRGRLR